MASLDKSKRYILPKYSYLFVLMRRGNQEHAMHLYWKTTFFLSDSIVKPGKALKLTTLKEFSLRLQCPKQTS